MALQFYNLNIKQVNPEAENSIAVIFAVPGDLQQTFSFKPGQYLTLKKTINGQELRRTYSISSERSRLSDKGELEIGIRPVEDGVFSNWAVKNLKAGDSLEVMPPDGRFTVKKERAIHRVGFAAGSGITPILSIARSTLQEQEHSKFTLVFGNRRMSSVMFNEALQDLKDRYPGRFTMIHVLSRQAQEVDMFEGRINKDKLVAIMQSILPPQSMDEVFICGPDAMIEQAEATLKSHGVRPDRVYTERFTVSAEQAAQVQANTDAKPGKINGAKDLSLVIVLDDKQYELNVNGDEHLLDAGLNAGLDLPFSCKAGVCSTCRCKVIEGAVVMDKCYSLEPDELADGVVLSCQARATSPRVVLSFDER